MRLSDGSVPELRMPCDQDEPDRPHPTAEFYCYGVSTEPDTLPLFTCAWCCSHHCCIRFDPSAVAR